MLITEGAERFGSQCIVFPMDARRKKDNFNEELSDLTYHSLVLLASKGLSIEDILGELEKRHR